MRLLYLYLRSRMAGWAVLALAVTGGFVWFWLWSMTDTTFPVQMLLIIIPLIPAVVIGASTRSPFGDTELSVSRSLPALRFGHLAGLLTLGGIMLVIVSMGWNDQSIGWELVRNLMGYTGLAFIGARILGSGICWVVPLGYGVISLLVDPLSRWAWIKALPADRWSVFVALILVIIGLIAVTLGRTHPVADDAG